MSFRHHIQTVVPAALGSDRRLSDFAVRLRLLMSQRGPMSIAYLMELTGASRNTVKNAVTSLKEAGWVDDMAPERAPRRLIVPTFPRGTEQALADRILSDRSSIPFIGEWLMRCWLDLLVASTSYTDNSRPDWLRTRRTGKRMEIDREYHHERVAFEYQGDQHFRTTKKYPDETMLEETQERDDLKAGMCARNGYEYVEIVRKNLCLAGMKARIPKRLPQRHYLPDGPIVRTLAQLSDGYTVWSSVSISQD